MLADEGGVVAALEGALVVHHRKQTVPEREQREGDKTRGTEREEGESRVCVMITGGSDRCVPRTRVAGWTLTCCRC